MMWNGDYSSTRFSPPQKLVFFFMRLVQVPDNLGKIKWSVLPHGGQTRSFVFQLLTRQVPDGEVAWCCTENTRASINKTWVWTSIPRKDEWLLVGKFDGAILKWFWCIYRYSTTDDPLSMLLQCLLSSSHRSNTSSTSHQRNLHPLFLFVLYASGSKAHFACDKVKTF